MAKHVPYSFKYKMPSFTKIEAFNESEAVQWNTGTVWVKGNL